MIDFQSSMEELQLSHSGSGRIWKKPGREDFSSQKLVFSTFHGSTVCPLVGASFGKNLKALVINARGKSYFLDFRRNQFVFFRTFRGVHASPCLLGNDLYSVQGDGSPIVVRSMFPTFVIIIYYMWCISKGQQKISNIV